MPNQNLRNYFALLALTIGLLILWLIFNIAISLLFPSEISTEIFMNLGRWLGWIGAFYIHTILGIFLVFGFVIQMGRELGINVISLTPIGCVSALIGLAVSKAILDKKIQDKLIIWIPNYHQSTYFIADLLICGTVFAIIVTANNVYQHLSLLYLKMGDFNKEEILLNINPAKIFVQFYLGVSLRFFVLSVRWARRVTKI